MCDTTKWSLGARKYLSQVPSPQISRQKNQNSSRGVEKTIFLSLQCVDGITTFKYEKQNWENIYQPSNCAWWGFNTNGFFWAGETRWVPWLLFRLRFRVSLGRSMGLPCWSTGWGHRAWCNIFQHCLVALGLQTYTIPGTSLVHDRQNVLGWLLQSGTMHWPWKGPVNPPLLKVWFPASWGRIGIESNS